MKPGLWPVLLSLLLIACGTSPTPAATVTTMAVETPVPTPAATAAPTDSGERIEIPAAGLSVEPPAGWQRLGQDWAWMPPGAEGQRVGLHWADVQPPAQPEAVLLPGNAQFLSSEPAAVTWGQARRVTLQVYGPAEVGQGRAPVAAVETHVLVVTTEGGGRRGYDFFASAPTAGELSSLQPVLNALLSSAAAKIP